MAKISIHYPYSADGRFDLDYYLKVHMPLSIQRLGSAEGFRSVSVERGVSGPYPDTKPAFVAVCHFEFDSYDAFVSAFTPHAEELQGDMSNYTDIEPIIQVNEVKLQRTASPAE